MAHKSASSAIARKKKFNSTSRSKIITSNQANYASINNANVKKKKRNARKKKKNGRKERCAALWIKHRLLSINCRKQTGNIELQCNSWYTLTASKQWNICRLLSPDLLCVDWNIYLSMSASSPKTVGDCYFLNFHSEHRANDHPCLRSWQKMTESL